ncbi:TetR/AcrR family transcriptional regulator [Gordonia sp. ABSL1-1]|uniref:TetR/AcrR family transcriptional regulator n=1 Tax=Gordonia sp. ABSL1-1 TaxID=3053923 RepID=UPI0025732FE2|nr:TetR/AcrR family transcriptional regulator [Gordonia sp. ABSL1-1]MDL9935192.1 TetR/AcrR family transcriptional regulator [Gordonia sp. ABSL1-1]
MGSDTPTTTNDTSPSAETSAQLRAYGGEGGDARIARRRAALIDAGLDLLGAADPTPVTVRGVCRRAELTARYFYESFESVDDLVAVVYDEVINEIAEAALDGFDRGEDVTDKVKGAVAAMVDIIDGDRRKGRLLFSEFLLSPVIATKRAESSTLFAGLTLQSASGVIELDGELGAGAAIAVAHYQVGGLTRLFAAWVEGSVAMSRDEIVELSVRLLLAPADIFGAGELITGGPSASGGRTGVEG